MQNVNWGILAPGNIAGKFAQALKSVEGANLACVASRSPSRAQQFAEEYGAARVAKDYAELMNDPTIDVIYVASPHSVHSEQSIACLEAGKAVLCEKPMTVNAEQAQRVIRAAQDNGVFYMEAVWSRFLPVYKTIRAWIDKGEIGDVKLINANFGFHFPYDPQGRLFNPDLAGGALLDLGIYPITFAQWVMSDLPPKIVSAFGTLGPTGVDDNAAITLQYDNGVVAALTTSTQADTDYDGWIIGTEGKIRVPYFWSAHQAELIKSERREARIVQRFDEPHACNGYEYEIQAVHRCLEKGQTKNALLPAQNSLQVMQIMDEIRRQLGVVYPFESI